MYRQFCKDSGTLNLESVVLSGEEAHHLGRVLRATPGREVTLFDGQGGTRLYCVTEGDKRRVTLAAAEAVVRRERPAGGVVLFACVCKNLRMEWLLEKAVELGAARIVPVLAARSVVRLNAQERAAKFERWERLVIEAAMQCGAVWLPEIGEVVEVADVAPEFPLYVASLAPEARPLQEVFDASSPWVGWCSGPEGDFTPEELEGLLARGAVPVSLGPLVLRAETAAMYGLCALGAMRLK